MLDPACFLLLQQIICKADLIIKVLIDVHLAYIVEQIEVEIVYLAFLELLLENLLNVIKVGKIVSREL